jgi:exodeoxyribonuclease VII small subunit
MLLKETKKIEKMTYEEAVKRLEEIVSLLEEAEIPLEQSFQLFQEGIALSRYCRDKLSDIEYRVEYLLKNGLQDSDLNGNENYGDDEKEDDQ